MDSTLKCEILAYSLTFDEHSNGHNKIGDQKFWDYAMPKIAQSTRRGTLQLMGHPAYSPDLSPRDLYLFPKIKEQLRGKNSQDTNELDAAVQEQMEGLRKEDFYQCFEYWFERMNKYISVQGHYFKQT